MTSIGNFGRDAHVNVIRRGGHLTILSMSTASPADLVNVPRQVYNCDERKRRLFKDERERVAGVVARSSRPEVVQRMIPTTRGGDPSTQGRRLERQEMLHFFLGLLRAVWTR